MNLSAVCEIRVTVCGADRLGQRFIPHHPASRTQCQTTISVIREDQIGAVESDW